MRFLNRFPLETRRLALGLTALFAVVAVLGGTHLRGQSTNPPCGNGVTVPPEECDEGTRNGNGPTCTVNCTLVECGDGIVTRTTGEECDSGSGSTASSAPSCGRVCSNTCKWTIVACTSSSSAASVSSAASSDTSAAASVAELSAASSAEVAPASSAPASVVPPSSSAVPSSAPAPAASAASSASSVILTVVTEGSSVSASSIASSVFSTAVLSSSSASSFIALPPPVTYKPVCGDGWIQATEECDDGNRLNGDGCSFDCTKADVLLPYCGDGQFQEPEECDAGIGNSNVTPDACRTNCRNAFCGDGVVDAGEACDDGNANEYDGCTWNCQMSVCGDGTIQIMEECDLGEKNSDTEPNVCRTVCRKPWCGDGVIDVTEECDDANDDDGDGCLSTCTIQCPEGSTKIQGRCIVLKPVEACGVVCKAEGAWKSFTTWIFSFFG